MIWDFSNFTFYAFGSNLPNWSFNFYLNLNMSLYKIWVWKETKLARYIRYALPYLDHKHNKQAYEQSIVYSDSKCCKWMDANTSFLFHLVHSPSAIDDSVLCVRSFSKASIYLQLSIDQELNQNWEKTQFDVSAYLDFQITQH